MTSPISPARTASRIHALCGAQRPFWLTASLHALVLGQLHEVLAHAQIGDEGFLAQHVLARLQRRLDDRRAMLGVERHVDHVDLGIGQHVLPVVLDPRGGAVFGGLRLGLGPRAVPECRDLPSRGAVGVEMAAGDAARADHPDPGAVGPGHRRAVGQVGGRDLWQRLGLQGIGVGIARILGHGISSNVRFSAAERAAVSTIRCAVRQRAGSSGPPTGSPRAIAAQHVFDGVALPLLQRIGGDLVPLGPGAGLDRDVAGVIGRGDGAVGPHEGEAAGRLRLMRPGVGEGAPAGLHPGKPRGVAADGDGVLVDLDPRGLVHRAGHLQRRRPFMYQVPSVAP
jgi:hypothetical protein